MDATVCPQCGSHAVHVVATSDGLHISSCQSCSWSGPMCFGRIFDPNNVKCSGGKDPTYWSVQNGHDRAQCKYIEQCKSCQEARVNSTLFPTRQGVRGIPANIPGIPSNTFRPQTPPVQTLPQTQPQVQHTVQYGQMQVQPAQQVRPVQPLMQQQQTPAARPQTNYGGYYAGQPQQQPVFLVPPDQAMMPMAVPQNHPQPGAQVPSYLTVPEPNSGSVVSMVILSMLRAALKGMFHTAANMMDHFPWGNP